jgi:hypothetical protein
MMWEYAEDLLLGGREYWEEFYTLDHLKTALLAGHMQLWLVGEPYTPRLAILTEFFGYPLKRELNILWIGGTGLKRGLIFLDSIELWAVRQGATASIVKGRQGWVRMLDEHGYSPCAVVLRKDLSDLKEH